MFASRNGGLVRRPNTPYSLPPNVKLDHKLLKDGDDKEDNEFAATGGEDNDEQQDFSLAAADAPSIAFWDKFPQRYKLIVTTSLAFVVCNMDKVRISDFHLSISHFSVLNDSKRLMPNTSSDTALS